jgi:TonB family protein
MKIPRVHFLGLSQMAHQPMLRVDHTVEIPGSKTFFNGNPGQERSYSLADLVRIFAQHGGESIAADLALDLVLNDLVRQACLASGASGAAIALMRDGEMVCRASSGPDAPALGVRLDTDSGLSGECVKSREVQLCADANTDPRVDSETCRRAGLRSILVLPLLNEEQLFGVFVAVSRLPNAFARLDTITLLGLAGRVVESQRQAQEALRRLQTGELQPATWQSTPAIEPELIAEAEPEPAETPTQIPQTDSTGGSALRPPRVWRLDFWTAFLAVLVFGAAMFMSALAGWRLGVRSVPVSHRNRPLRTTNAAGPETSSSAALSSPTQTPTTVAVTPKSPASASQASASPPTTSARLSAGGLVVYEKGKVVYRALPAPAATSVLARKAESNQKTVVLAADISPEMKEVTPDVAQALLVQRVEPEYPAEAKQQRIEGLVVLQAEISPEGRIQKLTLVSGDPALADSAISAVKRWRYRPYTPDGRPVAMLTTITVNFPPPAE